MERCPKKPSSEVWSPMNWSTQRIFMEVSERNEWNGVKKPSSEVWSPINWSTQRISMEVSERNEWNYRKKYSFEVWSPMNWSTQRIFMEVSERNEWNYPKKYSFEVWSPMNWSIQRISMEVSGRNEWNYIKKYSSEVWFSKIFLVVNFLIIGITHLIKLLMKIYSFIIRSNMSYCSLELWSSLTKIYEEIPHTTCLHIFWHWNEQWSQ